MLLLGIAPPPRRPGEMATEHLLRWICPQAVEVRVVQTTPSPKEQQQMGELVAPTLEVMSKGDTTRIHCERVPVTHEEGWLSPDGILFRSSSIHCDTAICNMVGSGPDVRRRASCRTPCHA